MAVVEGLSDARMMEARSRFCTRAGNQVSGTQDHWIWTRNCFQAKYCLGEDLTSSLLAQVDAGFYYLAVCSQRRRPFVLHELWRLIWQVDDEQALVRAADETRQTRDALWESKVYTDFLLGGPSTLPTGDPPVKDLGAALLLPREEAMTLVAEAAGTSVEAARSAPDAGRAIAALGPFGWRRGVAWARRRLDGVDIVPPGLETLFYGLPVLERKDP